MKEKLKNSPLLQSWFYTQSPLVISRPALREILWCLAHLLGGFILACGRLQGSPAPFALAYLAALGGGVRGLSCLLGIAAGYLTMQPFSQGLQMLSTAILIYVCFYIFGSLFVTKQRWFACVVAGVMTALVGAVFLVGQRLTLAAAMGYGRNVLLAGAAPLCYDRLLQGRRRSLGALIALGTLLLGAAAISLPLGMNLGCAAAVGLTALAARRTDLPLTAAVAVTAGTAMDLALGGGVWTLTLGAGALGAGISRRSGMLRLGGFFCAAGAAILFQSGAEGLGDLALGAGLSLLLPGGMILGREENAIERSANLVEQRLSRGQAVLMRLYDAIGADPAIRQEQDRSRIFDRSAAKVCRRCRNYELCWDREARDTYRMLRPVLEEIADRGAAVREDFPRSFSERCLKLDELVDALNRELDAAAGDRRVLSRRAEDRAVVSRYLLHLSALLEENARELRVDRPAPRENYGVRLGVSARGRSGARLSGDRGASFQREDGMYYVILCDGAGTGAPAAEESVLAVDSLTELIQAGMPPEHAMELLNGMYVLREAGSFSTMDVLELSLLTGQGSLYKWGAAPSYLRSGGGVRRIGSPSPPPGLAGDRSPERFPVDLWPGDLLALVSDGIGGEEAEALLRDFAGDNVKALAGALLERSVESGVQDDMTVAVIRLTERKKLQPGVDN